MLPPGIGPSANPLVAFVEHIRMQLQRFEPLWQELRDIDQNSWVIDPSVGTSMGAMHGYGHGSTTGVTGRHGCQCSCWLHEV